MRSVVIGASILAACAGVAAQTGTLDQVSTWTPVAPIQTASFNLDAPSLTWQQQVRAGMAGQLEGLRIPMLGPVGAQITLKVRLGNAWSAGAEVFTTTVTKAAAGTEVQFVDMTASNIQLAVSDTFVFETQGNATGMNLLGTYAPPATTPGPAYAEPLYLLGTLFADDRWRHGFESYMIAGGAPCYANCDNSTAIPVLNVADFTCFLQRYAAGESYANCDQSTTIPVLNVGDFTCFLQSYAAGCP